jgi:hypothetical protein
MQIKRFFLEEDFLMRVGCLIGQNYTVSNNQQRENFILFFKWGIFANYSIGILRFWDDSGGLGTVTSSTPLEEWSIRKELDFVERLLD